MTIPFFAAGDDPGPDFAALIQATSRTGTEGISPASNIQPSGDDPINAGGLMIPHGTTCTAMKYTDGVVIAGDRRATSGNLISHRDMEKIFSTDKYSAMAIAGAAGPAIEMARLFQLQLEHYEKVEGRSLTLDGKANQLSGMIRQNLPAAMRGMAVVPLFAGFDERKETGRLFQFDVTGGRYEEREYGVTGSGSLHAATVVKLGYRIGQDRDAAVDLSLRALFHAADEDSATGLPDFLRKIYPIVATIDESGFNQVDDDEIEAKYEVFLEEIAQQGLPA